MLWKILFSLVNMENVSAGIYGYFSKHKTYVFVELEFTEMKLNKNFAQKFACQTLYSMLLFDDLHVCAHSFLCCISLCI